MKGLAFVVLEPTSPKLEGLAFVELEVAPKLKGLDSREFYYPVQA